MQKITINDIRRKKMKEEAFSLTQKADDLVRKANAIYTKLNYKAKYEVKRKS